METRTQRVVIETSDYRIVGDVTLPREGYRSRVSDFLNRSDTAFVSLADATITGSNPTEAAVSVHRDFVAIGAALIQMAYPDDA